MLDGKRFGKPLLPILFHAWIHAVLMAVFLKLYGIDWKTVAICYTIQKGTHFIIDVWKGKMNVWFPSLQSPDNKLHWVVFGFDQLLHSVVIIWMAAII
mgnify:FL=1